MYRLLPFAGGGAPIQVLPRLRHRLAGGVTWSAAAPFFGCRIAAASAAVVATPPTHTTTPTTAARPRRTLCHCATTATTGTMAAKKTDVIALFDVDGTLTKPRLEASQETLDFLKELRTKILVGMVGGSDLVKQREQLGTGVLDMFDYTFSENGLVAYKGKDLIAEISLVDHLGEEKLQKLINFVLAYVAKLDIPIKRGTFIEFRKGMLNVSPIGRNCSQEERCAFEVYDNEHHVRKDFVAVLQQEFAEYKLRYSIGGQISFDVFPEGWDKTFALRYVDHIPTIHFFGDKTHPGGNDHEIYESERTQGHTVKDPAETMKICKELFF